MTQSPITERIEKQFIKWVEARDDGWWENGQGHISIWDIRVIIDFIYSLLEAQRREILEKVIGEDEASVLNEQGELIPDNGERQRNKFRDKLRSSLKEMDKVTIP